MAKSSYQKLKLLYLSDILERKTDDFHSITLKAIQEQLSEYGIKAERKSLYDDIEALRQYGMDIIGQKKGNSYAYQVGERRFELAELKLLVDAVQSSKFITAKKSNELIHKIEGLASEHEAKLLHRQVFVNKRIKTMNESIYYNVDIIHSAINENVKINFQYFQWNINKEPVLKRGGALYEVSPWALSWDDENYYLIGYEAKSDKIKHYRVDKMQNISLIEEKREGESLFQSFDMGEYSNKVFSMFGGKESLVKLRFKNELAGIVIDRFGKNITLIPDGKDHFIIHVNVVVSNQFFAWVIALGEGASLLGPESVLEQMQKMIAELSERYSR